MRGFFTVTGIYIDDDDNADDDVVDDNFVQPCLSLNRPVSRKRPWVMADFTS